MISTWCSFRPLLRKHVSLNWPLGRYVKICQISLWTSTWTINIDLLSCQEQKLLIYSVSQNNWPLNRAVCQLRLRKYVVGKKCSKSSVKLTDIHLGRTAHLNNMVNGFMFVCLLFVVFVFEAHCILFVFYLELCITNLAEIKYLVDFHIR